MTSVSVKYTLKLLAISQSFRRSEDEIVDFVPGTCEYWLPFIYLGGPNASLPVGLIGRDILQSVGLGFL
jgi:hypothetical protein